MTAPYYADDAITLHHGDSLDVLRTLETGSVDCCVTSPPYFGLRDYGHPGQIGAEKTPAEFVERLRVLFAEVRRVLADDGTMWLNLGDSYSQSSHTSGAPSKTLEGRQQHVVTPRASSRRDNAPVAVRSKSDYGIPSKNLMGIPWRVAFALQDDDSGDIYELNADAPDAIRSAVYLETCRTKIPKPAGNTPGNTRSAGETPTLSDTPSEWLNGTRPTATSSANTDASITSSTASKRSSETSRATDSVIAGSDLLRSNTTEANSPSAHAALSSESHSSPSTTSTAVERNTGGNSGHPVTVSSNGSAERDTPKVSVSSATTAMPPAVTTVHARTKMKLRKAQIQPDWLQYFRLVKQERWILRNAICWSKPNAMPESVTDRLSTRYEMLFMFSKSRRYWFDLDPIREDLTYPDAGDGSRIFGGVNKAEQHRSGPGSSKRRTGRAYESDGTKGKNPGDVWTIPTVPFPGSHFAVFPPELPRRCIVAGCKPGGTVLDPFHGSGTTGMVATRNGRKYVGIELNKEYLDLSLRTRLADGVLDFGDTA